MVRQRYERDLSDDLTKIVRALATSSAWPSAEMSATNLSLLRRSDGGISVYIPSQNQAK